jgi:hypothetical protein
VNVLRIAGEFSPEDPPFSDKRFYHFTDSNTWAAKIIPTIVVIQADMSRSHPHLAVVR